MASTGKSWSKEPTFEPSMTEQQLFELVLHSFRGVSIGHLQDAVASAIRAENVGPILYPGKWLGSEAQMHSLNINILRCAEGLRRALAEADLLQEHIDERKKAQ